MHKNGNRPVAERFPWLLKSRLSKGRGHSGPCRCFSSLHLYSTLLPQMYGRLPEVRLVRPCHGSFTPVRISHSRPPCVIPMSLGAGTGRKYPPARVMARQPTTGCFWDGRDRWAPYLAVIYADAVCTGGLGAPSLVALHCRERVQDRIWNCRGANQSRPPGPNWVRMLCMTCRSFPASGSSSLWRRDTCSVDRYFRFGWYQLSR